MQSPFPKTVYKYRSWDDSNHKKLLIDGEIYMSSPRDFNDPFDCKISIDYSFLDSDSKKIEYVENLLSRHKKSFNNIDIEKLKETVCNNMINDWEGWRHAQVRINENLLNTHYGVYSLTTKWDSILMWSHYGNFHKGFCVGFNEENLRNSELFSHGGYVSYRDDYPRLDFSEKDDLKELQKQIYSKAKHWVYEAEYRLTKLSFPSAFSVDSRKILISKKAFNEVNLGIKIPSMHRKEISKICYDSNIPVFQLEKKENEFKLERFLI